MTRKKLVITHLHHIALKVKNVESVAAFYRDILNLEESKRHHHDDGSLRSIWLEVPGTILMIEETPNPDASLSNSVNESVPHWHLVALGIKLEDREIWKHHLLSQGVKLESESPHSLYFSDIEGNRVCLSHHP